MIDDHQTPVTYSKDEARQIREAVNDRTKPLVCPRCGLALGVSPPVAGGGTVETVWELRCDDCRRSLLVTAPPPGRRFPEPDA